MRCGGSLLQKAKHTLPTDGARAAATRPLGPAQSKASSESGVGSEHVFSLRTARDGSRRLFYFAAVLGEREGWKARGRANLPG